MPSRFSAGILSLVGCLLISSCTPVRVDPASFQVRVPKGSGRTGKLPAFMVFGGFEEAGKVLDVVPKRDDVALATFDYPFHGHRRLKWPDTVIESPQLRNALGSVPEGILRLRQALAENPAIDPKKIGIIGASFGSPFAIEAAAEDPEIRWIIIIHGFADIQRVLASRLSSLLQDKLPAFLIPTTSRLSAWMLSQVFALPEPSEWAQKLRSGQHVLVFAARDDQFIPKESTEALRKALSRSNATVEWIETPGGHVGPGSGSLIQSMLETAARKTISG